MARTLSATLEAAQILGAVTWPYLVAKIRRKWGGVTRYVWTSIYEGVVVDGNHTATMPSDGSLIRLRVTDVGDSRKLYYQRVETPGAGSDFATWSYLSLYDMLAVASCSLGAAVFQAYIKSNREIRFRTSSNSGASWSAWSLLAYTTGTTINGFDAAYKSNGDICLAWNDSNNTYVKRCEAGSWQAAVYTSTGTTNKTGISIYHNSDWNIVLTYGSAGTASGVEQGIYGDGGSVEAGSWSTWQTIIGRAAGDPYIYYAPSVRRPDTTRLFFIESFTDPTASVISYYSHSPTDLDYIDCGWLEPVPLATSTVKGLCFSSCGNTCFLTNANTVLMASTLDDELDISSKILIVDINQSPDIFKGKLKLTIDNTAGLFNSFDRVGDEITIGLGFVTSAGNEYSLTSSFWITKFKLVSPTWSLWTSLYPSGITGTLEIEAEDAWLFLKRQKSRRTLSWAVDTKTVKELLTYFLARAGLELDVITESTAVTTFQPAFSVSRGETYYNAVKKLLKMVPDQLVFRESLALLRNPTTAEAADWVYHNTIGTGIMIFRGKYGSSAWEPNHVEVWGTTLMEASAVYPQIFKMGDRLSRVTDPDYPDSASIQLRLAGDLRKAEIFTGEDSWMFAMVNCGLEPWDKLQITDQSAGVSNIYRRAIRLKTYWTKLTYQYTQTLTLGAD
jgi:hypothetical protein